MIYLGMLPFLPNNGTVKTRKKELSVAAPQYATKSQIMTPLNSPGTDHNQTPHPTSPPGSSRSSEELNFGELRSPPCDSGVLFRDFDCI